MAAGETAGPSTALRSGRDDNSVAGVGHCSVASVAATTEMSSRPERTRISHFALPARTTGLNGKSGGAQWRDLLFLLRP